MKGDIIGRSARRFARRGWAFVAAAVVVLANPGLAFAHHSFAMFDQTRRLVMQGTVAEFRWGNPHVYLYVRGKDGKGAEARYVFEGGSVNMLSRNGWKPGSVRAGDQVTVTYYPLLNGETGGALRAVKLPDGVEMKTW